MMGSSSVYSPIAKEEFGSTKLNILKVYLEPRCLDKGSHGNQTKMRHIELLLHPTEK